MGHPKVSIGLPVYNGEKYLRSALDCALNQDFSDFEVIISDNASADGTAAICREYAARDSRIRYFRNETNIGARRNYNRVFELARGEFFKWASHDDKFDPSLIRRCLEVFAKSEADVVLVFSRAEIIDDEGLAIEMSEDSIDSTARKPSARLASLILRRRYAHLLWGLIRSDALRKTRLMGCTETDHVLLGELALQGRFVEIPEVLYWQRRHAGSAIQLTHTARALLAWNDPSKAKVRFMLPHWMMWDAEYWRGIRHAQLPALERLLCYAVVLLAPPWRRFLKMTGPLRHRLGIKRDSKRAAEADATALRAN